MEQFSCKTRIISGDGALRALGELNIRRLFFVADPYFVKNGVAQQIVAAAKAEKTEIFSKISPDPSVELAAEGTKAVQEFKPDTLVALGGGSAMDCAKAMVYFAGFPIRLIAIPTTSGSGSEVTDFSILTHNGVKHPLIDTILQPEVAILDNSLLWELPPSLIADTGFDILSHALEAYVAKNAGAVTDALAKDAFCCAFALLPASFSGNKAVRGKVHIAATMAGMAFNQAGLGLCHAMAHSLGGAFHLPHGRLNAILLPKVIQCNALIAGDKYARLARAADFGGAADAVAVRNLIAGLTRLRKQLQLPETLLQAGISPREVRAQSQQIVEATLADPCCKTNPLGVEGYMVHRILDGVTGRG
ncbi:MAG: iron-containing alcohol dehydrogenase [Oscillospiraceae bacterium]|nr:iron-containing alcohol dehydrogenase [Oscillospiraceae bacterium]